MARGSRRSTKRPAGGKKPEPRARDVTEGVEVEAVRATSGRAATTVHVQVEPDRLRSRTKGTEDVRRVVAEIPTTEDDGAVRWDDQPLDKAAEEQGPDGARRIHYSATRMAGEDSARYGIGVRIETEAGALHTPPGGMVKNADEPED